MDRVRGRGLAAIVMLGLVVSACSGSSSPGGDANARGAAPDGPFFVLAGADPVSLQADTGANGAAQRGGSIRYRALKGPVADVQVQFRYRPHEALDPTLGRATRVRGRPARALENPEYGPAQLTFPLDGYRVTLSAEVDVDRLVPVAAKVRHISSAQWMALVDQTMRPYVRRDPEPDSTVITGAARYAAYPGAEQSVRCRVGSDRPSSRCVFPANPDAVLIPDGRADTLVVTSTKRLVSIDVNGVRQDVEPIGDGHQFVVAVKAGTRSVQVTVRSDQDTSAYDLPRVLSS